jgi:amino-acid N-acetyltransferase
MNPRLAAPTLRAEAEPPLDLETRAHVAIRPGTPADAPALYALVTANLEAGRLLPRTLADLVQHAGRFLVLTAGEAILGCGEVAPLSPRVAEIRSLVVDERVRGRGLGSQLVDALKARARRAGFETLCAFTHQPATFVRHGFSIVPHVWLPEKIAHDCCTCPHFRRCGQYAMWVSLRPGTLLGARAGGPAPRAALAGLSPARRP